jgi:hypothetical protein
MLPENQPHHRLPWNPPRVDDSPSAAAIQLQDIFPADPTANKNVPLLGGSFPNANGTGMQYLSNWPNSFSEYSSESTPIISTTVCSLYNSNLTATAWPLSCFNWAVYGFNSGHFISSIRLLGLPFAIVLASDKYANSRSLFTELFACTGPILGGCCALLDHIKASGITSKLSEYLVYSRRYNSTELTSQFWQLQAAIVSQLRLTRLLSIIITFVHPDHNSHAVSLQFINKLKSDGWIIFDQMIQYSTFGVSLANGCRLIVGVHSHMEEKCTPMVVVAPPLTSTNHLSSYLWALFNRPEITLSYSRDNESFNNHAFNNCRLPPLIASDPPSSPNAAAGNGVSLKYCLHCIEANPTIQPGSYIVGTEGLCPRFEPCDNSNLFCHHFGMEFHHEGHNYVQAISPFEFARCFNLDDNITYKLSHPSNIFCLDATIPGRTLAHIFNQVISHLVCIRDANCSIFSPSQYAAPAACAQAFLNGAVGIKFPDKDQWVKAYSHNPVMRSILGFAKCLGTISNKALEASDINYNYRAALWHLRIVVEDKILIYCKPIVGSLPYARLQLVRADFFNILFVPFHTNPIGRHFNTYHTFHFMHIQFYWPGMFKYIKRMCRACPGCALANPSHSKSAELVYHFPIEAPMMVLHIDGYLAGKQVGFEGSEIYLNACCKMSTFAAMEPVINPSAITFVSTIMKIIMRYGFCHTVVLNKDSKFFGVCWESLNLLKIKCHVLSGGNHNPMLVERINRYLNKGLKIMVNEQDSPRIALKEILLLIYAWNSCPVPGTDISRSLVAVGREFQFPINFSTGKHIKLMSAPGAVLSYSCKLASCLAACRQVASILVEKHRCWHRELINSQQRDPRIYHEGDIVFIRHITCSDAKRGLVDKLQYSFTGPWRIVASLPGGSYELEHVLHQKHRGKKHALALLPYPLEMIPFQPLDGADNCYSQLHKIIRPSSFKKAGLKGFDPPQPFTISSHFAQHGNFKDFYWPTLAKLNDPFPWLDNKERRLALEADDNHIIQDHVLYTGPPPSPAAYQPPCIPPISSLVVSIIQLSNKLFFIAHLYNLPTKRMAPSPGCLC